MRQILILAATLLCIFNAQAEDDYPTIVRYLGENGHFIISPSDVAKVQVFMKEHGYQHVSDIPKGSFATGPSKMDTADPVMNPSATASEPSSRNQTSAPETEPSSRPLVTHIVVPSATPVPASSGKPSAFWLVIIGIYCLPVLIAIESSSTNCSAGYRQFSIRLDGDWMDRMLGMGVRPRQRIISNPLPRPVLLIV